MIKIRIAENEVRKCVSLPWSGGVRYAGAERFRICGDKVVVDPVLQGPQDNHRPRVVNLNLQSQNKWIKIKEKERGLEREIDR